MSIPEATQLIIQAGSLGNNGEIFVLDMGEQINIKDLAYDLISLSGLRPKIDIPIEYIGIRPGEKLEEELYYDNTVIDSSHPKIMILKVDKIKTKWVDLKNELNSLIVTADSFDKKLIFNSMQSLILKTSI